MDQDEPTLPLPSGTPHAAHEAETLPPKSWDGTTEAATAFLIGPYRLLKQLGAGGMGEVWVAEQTEPVKRQVALKLIKSGIGSKEIIARFEAERQALALMNHPNIAKILDAGTTADGQPFFVMELVNGQPLTEFCDQQKLGIEDRLKLFADVCSGVQHAHQKGIIHRDLKPGNIIVGMQDGKAVAKIIDFGLAKAMESTQRLTEQSLMTGIGQILGTLKYMSPEQASLDNVDIDTRSDIYSLGVILYELLTGSTPLDNSSLKGQAALQVLEFIRDREPIKPSSKLSSSSAAEVSTITGQRQTDSARLRRILAGDLDWIVMKALEKDRTRRYESASGFAADIQRYLHSEPVIARPPSLNYRVRKFVRKNRVVVLAASMISLAMLSGIVGTSLAMFRALAAEQLADGRFKEAIEAKNQESEQRKVAVEQTKIAQKNAEIAETEKNIAVAVRSFLQKNLLRQNSIWVQASTSANKKDVETRFDLSMRELLDRAAIEYNLKTIENQFPKQPQVQCEIIETIGDAFLAVGEYQKSLEFLRGAIRIRESYQNPGHPEALGRRVEFVIACLHTSQFSVAVEQANEIADLLIEASNASDLTETLGQGEVVMEEQKPEFTRRLNAVILAVERGFESEQHVSSTGFRLAESATVILRMFQLIGKVNRLYGLAKSAYGEIDRKTLYIAMVKGYCLYASGRTQAAVDTLLSIQERVDMGLPSSDFLQISSRFALTLALDDFEQESDRSLKLKTEIVESMSKLLGPGNPNTLESVYRLAKGYFSAKQPDKGFQLLEEALRTTKSEFGSSHPLVYGALVVLAMRYFDTRQMDKALPLMLESWELAKEIFGKDHPESLASMSRLATAFYEAGALDKALPLMLETLELQKSKLGVTHHSTLTTMHNLAAHYKNVGEFARALTLFEEVCELTKSELGLNHVESLTAMENLANAYSDCNQLDKSLSIFEEVLRKRKARFSTDDPSTIRTMHTLGAIYGNTGKYDKALPMLREALTLLRNKLGRDHLDSLICMNDLGVNYWRARQFDLSVPLFEELVSIQERTLGRDHKDTLSSIVNLGVNCRDAGRLEDAAILLEEAYAAKSGLPRTEALAWVGRALSEVYFRQKRVEDYQAIATEYLAQTRAEKSENSLSLAEVLVSASQRHMALSLHSEAIVILRESLEIFEEKSPEVWTKFLAQSLLGSSLLATARNETDASKKAVLLAESEPFLVSGYKGLLKKKSELPVEFSSVIPEAIERLIELYTLLEKPDEIKKYRELKDGYPEIHETPK